MSAPLTDRLLGQANGPNGDRPAVSYRDQVHTFRDLQRQVAETAGQLRRAGLQPKDRVLLRLGNEPHFTAAWLAAIDVGAVPVTAAMSLGATDLAAIITDARPTVAVTSEIGLPRIAGATTGSQPRCRWFTVGQPSPLYARIGRLEDQTAPAAPIPGPLAASADDIAAIVYTVDADGTYRGACHSAEAMIASAEAYARGVLNMSPADVVAGHPPMALAYGLGALLVFPLVTGARVVLTGGFDAEVLLRTIERERVTIFFGTPTAYRLFLRIPNLTERVDLRSLRTCVSAGERLDAATSAEWQRRTGVDLVDGLGTTELFHIVLSQRPGDITHGSLGTPVPGYEARVVDDDMTDVAEGNVGRLAIRGPTRCRYWNSPQSERSYVRDGWNLTGDLVARDAEGRFWFHRRADDLIISAGYNIAPPEIESVLLTHPAVAAAAVVSIPDVTRGAVPKAFIVARSEGTPALALALQEHVQRALASYKTPRQIEFVKELPSDRRGHVGRHRGSGGLGPAGP